MLVLKGDKKVLWVIIVMFLAIWAFCLLGGAGAYIHVLLVPALGVFCIWLFQGRASAH